MQFAKDSVYVALRDRLAVINPQRVLEIAGVLRPAVLVAENQALTLRNQAPLVRDAFVLHWGSVEAVAATSSAKRPLMKLALQISYSVAGTDASGNGRGRALGAMDSELLQMCVPRRTAKQDYTQPSPVPLGSMVFWSDPHFSAPEESAGVLRRIGGRSVSAQRTAMTPISRRVRAYFAPVDRTTGTGAVFDPAKHGAFALDTPPTPWVDLGWIEGFRRTSATRFELLRAGAKGAAVMQTRAGLEARLEFEFRQWGKLQMALAGGSQHMNVLAADVNADPGGSGGTAITGVAVLPGSTASELVFGAGAVDSFAVGDILAVDADYQQETGYVGSPIAGAYVRNPFDVLLDASYLRRVTFNVGRIASKTATSVILAQPLIGGAPAANASAQKVIAFVDREGGSFYQEWSALFVVEEESGGRICFHYPRLQPTAAAAEQKFDIASGLAGYGLHAAFLALPHRDLNDNEQVLCYRSYFPAAGAALY
jgi:hypothetical protein